MGNDYEWKIEKKLSDEFPERKLEVSSDEATYHRAILSEIKKEASTLKRPLKELIKELEITPHTPWEGPLEWINKEGKSSSFRVKIKWENKKLQKNGETRYHYSMIIKEDN